MKQERSYRFWRKGHQEQHYYNERVAKFLEEAVDEISKRPVIESALGKARQAIKEDLKQTIERQKLIKIGYR